MHQFKGDIDARNLTIIKINKKQKQTKTTHIRIPLCYDQLSLK